MGGSENGLDRDDVAGAHPKSAPDFVLLTGACQARLTKKIRTKPRGRLNLINIAAFVYEARYPNNFRHSGLKKLAKTGI